MSTLHRISLCLLAIQHSAADALAENRSKSETVGWQPDPDGRGTFTLVSNCILTLIICVYSAMHLNVPPRGESVPNFWLRNIRWALLGILGPELVVFIAWKQYLSAKAVTERSQRRNHEKDSPRHECQTEKHAPTVIIL